ncbi:MAG: hypothetical protein ACKORY_01935 [Actinomycetota bacterium]
MRTLLRILAVRALRGLGTRSRLVSRVLVVAGVVRWWNSRPSRRRWVHLGPDDTLVVGIERGRGDRP